MMMTRMIILNDSLMIFSVKMMMMMKKRTYRPQLVQCNSNNRHNLFNKPLRQHRQMRSKKRQSVVLIIQVLLIMIKVNCQLLLNTLPTKLMIPYKYVHVHTYSHSSNLCSFTHKRSLSSVFLYSRNISMVKASSVSVSSFLFFLVHNGKKKLEIDFEPQ